MGYNQRREGDAKESSAHTFRIGSTFEKVIAALLTALVLGTVAGFFEMKSSITGMNTNIAELNANMNSKIAELNANMNSKIVELNANITHSKLEFDYLEDRVEALESSIDSIKSDYVRQDMFMGTLKRIELYIRNLLLTVGMKEGTLDASSTKMSID